MAESMNIPLLLTKIAVPPQRTHVVPRERLLERMPEHSPVRLVVLSAPAGAGKTTFLTHWCHSLIADGEAAVAWYSLDPGDNDPARFAAYLLASFSRAAAPDTDFRIATQLLGAGPDQGLEPMLAALLNEITLGSRPYVLVLDDYHTITAPEVHLAIAFLLDHAPAQLRIVIGSRADPPLHLARLRVRDQLVEFHMADLRFSTEEVRAFFDHGLDTQLSAETAQLIETTSEGWAAGLQLIALSLTGYGQPSGEAALRETLMRLAESRRHIFDYLADEVFEQQSPHVRHFLLTTSALGQLSGDLCDTVLEGEGHQSRAVLEHLEHSNLFVIPLDAEHHWYRYHHLFDDFLQERREREQPGCAAEIHRRASSWYRSAGMLAPAIDHALAAADYMVAGEMIDAVATAMNARGEAKTLRAWLQQLPQAIVEQRPALSLWWAWSAIFEGKIAESVRFLDLAEQAWSIEHNQPKLGEVWHARAHVARIRGDAAETLRFAQQALLDLPEDADTLRAGSVIALGAGYLLAGDLNLAEQTLRRAQALCQASNFLGLIATTVYLGEIAALRGQLDTAVTHYQEALALVDGRPITGYFEARIKQAEVWLQWNDLDNAYVALQQTLAGAEATGYQTHLSYGYSILARVLWARGDLAAAADMFERAAEVAQQVGSAFYRREAEAYLARLRLAQGDRAAVAAWQAAGEASNNDALAASCITEALTQARILITQGNAEKALILLQQLHVPMETQGQISRCIEIELLQALALERLHRRQEALHTLECTLRLAASGNIARTFLDEGAALADLLGKGQAIGGWGLNETARGIPVRAYARTLLDLLAGNDRTHADGGDQLHASEDEHRRTATGEIISAREIEVLRLMARGASNQEIADTLIVSLGTVKSHLTHIMGKLQARNRTEAVARARELGCLSG